MKTIRIINQLDLNNGSLVTTASKDYGQVFLRQGSMDGACGPYCLFMALLINGVVSWDEVQELWGVKGSTRLGKLLKGMKSHHTLFTDGTHTSDLEQLLDDSFGHIIEMYTSDARGKKLTPFIVDRLNDNNPVIVCVRGKGFAHWLLAIGYEVSEQVTKLFFLDPSGSNTTGYWNAAIEVNPAHYRVYPYAWLDFKENENEFVQLDEAIALKIRR